MKFREHPLRIMRYSAKNLWLLIFPLLRGISVLKFDLSGIYRWIKGAWLDIAVIGIIIVYGYIQWHFSEISIDENKFCHKKGVIFRKNTVMPFDSVSSAAEEILFFLVPFKAVSIRLDTGAGFYKSADLKLLVKRKCADEIMKCIPDVKKENAVKEIPEPGIASVLLFSVFFSSGFSGAVYIAAFFFKGGDIAKDILSIAFERVTKQAEAIYSQLLSGIPKAAAMVAIFFMGMWFISFIRNLLMYAWFRISTDGEFINVAFGLFRRRKNRIRTEHINYIDLRQNLIMKICSAYTVNISCPGYGYASHLPVIFPISHGEKTGLFSMKGVETMKCRPAWTSFFSYIGVPFFGIIAVASLYHFSDYLLWDDRGLWKFLAVMFSIPLVWLVLVKTAALFTSGIMLYGDRIVLLTVKGTTFHRVTAKIENVTMVQLNRNIIQRIFHKCTAVIWFTGETSSCYKVKGLWFKDVVKISANLKCNKM
ncbi:MAG: PH domain-containing protein [Ruminococcus sp.]|nr:PH domain-containing protein [Ruminococcus sp.]